MSRYELPLPDDARRSLAAGWMLLALVALAAAGVLSLLLVASRAPGIKDVFPLVDFFHVALVAHVDLSVLVWFLAFAGALWSLNSRARALSLGWAALGLALAGTALMATAPFAGSGHPVMSNYIPVLDEPVFLAGLVACGAARRGAPGRGRSAALRPEHLARVGGRGGARLRLVIVGGAARHRRARLLRARVLGRRARAPVHLYALDVRRLARAGRGRRRAAAAHAAHRGAAVRHRPPVRVPHAGDLPRLRRRLGRAPPHADLADALRRRAGDRALRARRRARACARAGAIALATRAARRAARLARPVRRRRADRPYHQRQQRQDPRPLPRLDRRRDARLHGAHLLAAAAPRIRRGGREARAAAAVAVRRRAALARRGAGVVGRLRRAAQGRRRGRGAARHRADRCDGRDGARRADRRDRRNAVPGARLRRGAAPPRRARAGPRLRRAQWTSSTSPSSRSGCTSAPTRCSTGSSASAARASRTARSSSSPSSCRSR